VENRYQDTTRITNLHTPIPHSLYTNPYSIVETTLSYNIHLLFNPYYKGVKREPFIRLGVKVEVWLK